MKMKFPRSERNNKLESNRITISVLNILSVLHSPYDRSKILNSFAKVYLAAKPSNFRCLVQTFKCCINKLVEILNQLTGSTDSDSMSLFSVVVFAEN